MTLADGEAVVLPSDMTLDVVRREICDNPMHEEILLYYRIYNQQYEFEPEVKETGKL